jgi:hypothetical protein
MRSEYCLAGGYGFAKDKGDWWMTEESYVDRRTLQRVDVMLWCGSMVIYSQGMLMLRRYQQPLQS